MARWKDEKTNKQEQRKSGSGFCSAVKEEFRGRGGKKIGIERHGNRSASRNSTLPLPSLMVPKLPNYRVLLGFCLDAWNGPDRESLGPQ